MAKYLYITYNKMYTKVKKQWKSVSGDTPGCTVAHAVTVKVTTNYLTQLNI